MNGQYVYEERVLRTHLSKENAMNGCIRTWVSTVLMFICTNMRSYYDYISKYSGI